MITIVGADLKHVAMKIEIIILKQCHVNKELLLSTIPVSPSQQPSIVEKESMKNIICNPR